METCGDRFWLGFESGFGEIGGVWGGCREFFLLFVNLLIMRWFCCFIALVLASGWISSSFWRFGKERAGEA